MSTCGDCQYLGQTPSGFLDTGNTPCYRCYKRNSSQTKDDIACQDFKPFVSDTDSWHLGGECDGTFDIINGEGDAVAEVTPFISYEQCMTSQQVLARFVAAQDLLAICEAIIEEIDYHDSDLVWASPGGAVWSFDEDLIDKLREVIAFARGEYCERCFNFRDGECLGGQTMGMGLCDRWMKR